MQLLDFNSDSKVGIQMSCFAEDKTNEKILIELKRIIILILLLLLHCVCTVYLHIVVRIYGLLYFPNFIFPKHGEHLPTCDTSYTPTNLYSTIITMRCKL